MSTNDKNLLERAVDLLVFAPLGMALTARDALPELIERGREQATAQVTLAKMMGEFAVRQGRQEADRALGQLRHQAEGVLSGLGASPLRATGGSAAGPTGGAGATAAASTPPARASHPGVLGGAGGASGPADGVAGPARPTSGPGAAELAIPDYDSLSASQVVPRLAGLSAEELEAVRGYEEAHRGRKTILNRVAQLQAS